MKYTAYPRSQPITIDTDKGTIKGQTYHVKDDIKMIFTGIRWDGASKAWKMDTAAMLEVIEKQYDYLYKIWELRGVEETKIEAATTSAKPSPTAPSKPRTTNRNGLCPKCHTYCYGDCSAH